MSDSDNVNAMYYPRYNNGPIPVYIIETDKCDGNRMDVVRQLFSEPIFSIYTVKCY